MAAATWYEARKVGLGIEFVAEVDLVLSSIAENPKAWPRWRRDRPYRKRTLQRFPFVIFYRTVRAGEVEVTAIAHAKRKPGYWVARRRS